MAGMIEDRVWAGSEASLQAALNAEEARAARIAAGDRWDEDEREDSRLLSIDEDGLATIQIKGGLNNSADALWNEWIGATGYPEIREALVQAANNPDVKHILLDIDSGGGAVAGVADTGNLIRLVNDKVKPVTTFTDGNMMSAAYWLGAAAGSVYATKGAGVGSIGVIATHMERSKMLAEAGIGVNVIRAGKYKALANSVEPLSEEGRKQIQAAVNAAYDIFVDHVATMRGKSAEHVDTVMAQGREFFGQAAADAGLVDGIMSFDALVGEIKKKFIDPSVKSMDNRRQQAGGLRVEHQGDAVMAGKKTLTEAQIAALAAGANLEAAADQGTVDVEAAVEGAPAETSAETPQTEDPSTETKQEVDTSAQSLKFMTDQLKAAQDDLLAARLAQAKAEDKLSELTAVVEPLKAIAAKAVNNMRVALGGSAMDMSAMSPAQVVADHAAMSESFLSKFKAGGVSAVSATEKPKSETQLSAVEQARLNAVRRKQK